MHLDFYLLMLVMMYGLVIIEEIDIVVQLLVQKLEIFGTLHLMK